jgi:hypothetical protein
MFATIYTLTNNRGGDTSVRMAVLKVVLEFLQVWNADAEAPEWLEANFYMQFSRSTLVDVHWVEQMLYSATQRCLFGKR